MCIRDRCDPRISKRIFQNVRSCAKRMHHRIEEDADHEHQDPVSYTHLDVYKRQVCKLTDETYPVNEGLVEAMIPPESIRILEIEWI